MTDTPHLESVETKLAFQEDAIQQLSDALIAQQARIDRLEARVTTLAEQLRAQGDNAADGEEPPPPHY